MKQADDQERANRVETVEEQDRLPNLRDVLPDHMLTPLLRNPPRQVTIYRAVPEGITEIRPGDWVALDRNYAASHGRGSIIKKVVPARDVVWAGTDLNEFFYIPETIKSTATLLSKQATYTPSPAGFAKGVASRTNTALEKYYDRFEEWSSSLQFPLTLYRALDVPPDEVDWDALGIHWATDLDNAVVHFGDRKKDPTVIEIEIREDAVDWEETFLNNARYGWHETEVNLRPGASVKIVAVTPENEITDEVVGTIKTAAYTPPPVPKPGTAAEATRIIDQVDTDEQVVFYHASTSDNDESIRSNWLEPQIGPWVQEVMNGATDDEEAIEQLKEESTGVVYLSKVPDWVISLVSRKLDNKPHDQITLDDIRQWGQLTIAVVDKDSKDVRKNVGEEESETWHYGDLEDLRGNREPFYDSEKYFGLEPGDHFSTEAVEPAITLVGEELVKFLQQHFPATLKGVKKTRLKRGESKQAADITETPAFKAWFSGSKVVDAQGNPLVVYHGTRSDFHEFKGLSFFAADPEYADGFAGDEYGISGGQIMPCYLSIKNPFDARSITQDLTTREWAELIGLDPRYAMDDFGPQENPFWYWAMITPQTKKLLLDKGYDGLIQNEKAVQDSRKTTAYAAFHANQIKSALGNSGAFDPQDKRITAALNIEPWIGIDLDGTLAQSIDDYSDPTLIGLPIDAMVEKVKKALENGERFKVFTARMADKRNWAKIQKAVGDWTEKYIGVRIEATNEKDPGMVELWDDKARQVIENTGEMVRVAAELIPVDPILDELMKVLKPGLPVPRIEIVNTPNKSWRGECSWTYGADNTVIRLQRFLLYNELALRKTLAHELAHHEEHLVHVKPKYEKLPEKQFKAWYRKHGDHGDIWLAIAARFNAVYGADFVTESSDMKDVTFFEESEDAFYVVMSLWPSGQLDWKHTKKITPQIRLWLKKRLQNNAGDRQFMELTKVFKTTDSFYMHSPSVAQFGGAKAKSEEQEQKARQLFEQGEDILADLVAGKKAAVDAAQVSTREGSHPGVTTPGFDAWFAGSKVVDEDGNPLTVYHGTTGADFEVFNTESEGHLGSHFGDQETAHTFAHDDPDKDPKLGGRIIPVYLSIKNPLRIEDPGSWDLERLLPKLEKAGVKLDPPKGWRSMDRRRNRNWVVNELQQRGYDGIVYANWLEGDGSDSWVVFEPQQIKSAIGNSGAFDPDDERIVASVKKRAKKEIPELSTEKYEVSLFRPLGADPDGPASYMIMDRKTGDVPAFADTPEEVKQTIERLMNPPAPKPKKERRLEPNKKPPKARPIQLGDAASVTELPGFTRWIRGRAKLVASATTVKQAGEIVKTAGMGGRAVHTIEYANQIAEQLSQAVGSKVEVVGSVKTKGISRNDIDLLVTDWNRDDLIQAMVALGFVHFGQSSVSPEEAKKSGKGFPPGWHEVLHFRDEAANIKVELWHGLPEPKSASARVSTREGSHPGVTLFHGSPDPNLTGLQPGTMLTDLAHWSAGYTTKINYQDLSETFVGKVYCAHIPSGKYLKVEGGLHDAEQALITESRRIRTASLRDCAGDLASQGYVAVIAQIGDGPITGALSLVATPVVGQFDPVAVLEEAKKKGIEIPDNMEKALALHRGKVAAMSQAFEKWFAGSKVVDGEGNPLQCYHGTKSSIDFEEFSTSGPVQGDDDEEITSSGSGPDVTAFLGAHFAQESSTANQFAMGQGWMKSRYDGDQERPRIIPVYLAIKNPKDFGPERALRHFCYQGELTGYEADLLNRAMEQDGIEDPEDYDDPEVSQWSEKYNSNPDFRAEQHEWLFEHYRPAEGEERDLDSAAHDLGQQARSRLEQQGHDGIRYKNQVEGGISWIVFQPNQVKSAYAQEFNPEDNRYTAGLKTAKLPPYTFAASKQATDDKPETDSVPPVTETPAFKAWFSGSKVVDGEGNPLRVFHGTTRDFDKFAPSRRKGLGGVLGFWFSSTPEGAQPFTQSRMVGDRPMVMPLYLSIKNPMVFEGHKGLVDAAQERRGESVEQRLKSLPDGPDGDPLFEDESLHTVVEWAIDHVDQQRQYLVKRASCAKTSTDHPYADQTANLKWDKVDANVWETIEAEGLDEEQGETDPSRWQVAELAISPEDSAGLRQLNDETVEKFNRYDIWLKQQYGGKLTDLVDYDAGVVRILRVLPEDGEPAKQAANNSPSALDWRDTSILSFNMDAFKRGNKKDYGLWEDFAGNRHEQYLKTGSVPIHWLPAAGVIDQARFEKSDPETGLRNVRQIEQAMREGKKFEPALMDEGWLIDGNHRVFAAGLAGLELIPVVFLEDIIDANDGTESVQKEAGLSKPAPYPEDWHDDLVSFTPEFKKKLNDASIEATRNRGRVMKPYDAGTVREAFVSNGLVDHLPEEILNVHIWFASRLNGLPLTGFAAAVDLNGNDVIYMHPSQASAVYVRGLVHELQHIADRHAGWELPDNQELALTNWQQYRKQPAERRSQRAENSGRILVRKRKAGLADEKREDRLMGFFDEFSAATSPNPLNNREDIWNDAVGIEVSRHFGRVRINAMRSLKPGAGYATKALQFLKGLADKHEVELELSPVPFGSKRLNQRQLKQWYGRHGFEDEEKKRFVYRPQKQAGLSKNPALKPDANYLEQSNGWALFPDQREGQYQEPIDEMLKVAMGTDSAAPSSGSPYIIPSTPSPAKPESYLERTYYRGSTPGATERITTGSDVWDACLFVSDDAYLASAYGRHIDEYHFKPWAKIVAEGTAAFNRLGRLRKGENMLEFCTRIVKAAAEKGYDAVHFKMQGDIGTAVINRDSIEKTGVLEGEPKRREKEAAAKLAAEQVVYRSSKSPDAPLRLNQNGILYTSPDKRYTRYWGQYCQTLEVHPKSTLNLTRFNAHDDVLADDLAAFLEQRGVEVSEDLRAELESTESIGGEMLQYFGQTSGKTLVECIKAAGYDSALINEWVADTGMKATSLLLFDLSGVRVVANEVHEEDDDEEDIHHVNAVVGKHR